MDAYDKNMEIQKRARALYDKGELDRTTEVRSCYGISCEDCPMGKECGKGMECLWVRGA